MRTEYKLTFIGFWSGIVLSFFGLLVFLIHIYGDYAGTYPFLWAIAFLVGVCWPYEKKVGTSYTATFVGYVYVSLRAIWQLYVPNIVFILLGFIIAIPIFLLGVLASFFLLAINSGHLMGFLFTIEKK